MSAIYDNWERLVSGVLRKEELWQLFNSDSVSSDSSAFSFSHLDQLSFCFSDLGWSASGTTGPPPSIVVEKEKLPITCTPPRERDLESETKWGGDSKQQSYPLPLPPGAKSTSRVESPWKKGRLIGRGLLGDVYVGFNSENGGMRAIWEVPLSSVGKKETSARIKENEIALLSHMRHPNIIRNYGSEMVADNLKLYYEYMSRGSIYMILEQYGRLGESVISSYTQQILSGLAYLHSKSITHGDINGHNILINPNGIVKLSNLGIEKQIAEKFRTSSLMDRPYWMAPEVIMNPDVRNLAVDIWSLGCTVLEMATSKPPLSKYDGVVDMSRVVYHKELPTIPDHLSAVCKDFLRHCLRWDPLDRATASQLLEHPFVKGLSPLVDKILVSTPLGRPALPNSVKLQSSDHARNLHQLESGFSKASKFNFCSSNIYTPRSALDPTSQVGSPLLHPRSPQQLSRRTPPPPKFTPHTASNSFSPIGAIQLPRLNQPTIYQDRFHGFPKQSPNSISPSYWDPNILRGMSLSNFHELPSSDYDT